MKLKKNLLIIGSVVIAASTLLAACGSSSGSASKPASPTSGNKTISVGLSSVLSGPASIYGTTGKGAIAYFKTMNAHGGINGYKFTWTQKDNGYSSAQAVAVATQLVQSDKVNAIITEGTPPTVGLFPIAKSLGVPILAAAGGNYFTPPPAPNIFSQNPPYSGEAEFEARFAMNTLGDKKLALAYEDDDVGIPASQVLPKYVPSHGGQLVTSMPIANTVTDLSPFASRLKASGATAVIGFLGTSLMADLQKACAAIGYKPTWITFFAAFDPGYFQLAGSLTAGVYADGYMLPLTPSTSATKMYTEAMTKYYPSEVQSVFAQQGWNFAAILAKAVAVVTSGGKAPTNGALVAAISRETGQVGLMRSVSFSAKSYTATHGSAMYQLNASGGAKQVTPYSNYPSTAQG